MIEKIESEVPFDVSQKSFEVIRKNSDIFAKWTKREMDTLIPYFKILHYTKNTSIISENEEIQFFALVLSGKILLLKNQKIINYLESGEFLGYYPLFKLKGTLSSKFNYIAENDGYLALLTYSEMKLIQKKDPLIYFKLLRSLHLYSLNVLYYQFTGEDLSLRNDLEVVDIQFKDFVSMINSFPEFSRFFSSVDKSGQRALFNSFRLVDVQPEVC
jgi:hypothetical protein